ncbi:MAG: UTP--glucose-1-phosphate uridylyltransferase [Patescibacteria group bacterium]
MKKITKAVIPVAGLGTRFLPATKAMPKEMLPLIDKPILQYVVEEAVQSGITDIVFVTSYLKRACEDHFDASPELEKILKQDKKKQHLYEQIRAIPKLANFIYLRQKGPYGNGTPVLNAEHVIGDEPFAVLWGDEIFDCERKPRLRQLIDVYEKYGDPVLTGYQISRAETSKYGVIDGTEVERGIYQVKKIVEKPGPRRAPSTIASLGAYILTPDIFTELKKTKRGKNDELWLVDAIFKLRRKRPIYAKIIEGTFYDMGSRIGWLKANVTFALKDPELRKELQSVFI